MRGRSPHLCLALVAIAATALVVATAPAAQAANPQVNHFEFAFAFTWTDFCGTGTDVDVAGNYRATEFLAPNQPVDERVKLEGKTVYVNEYMTLTNGAFAVKHVFAGSTRVASKTMVQGQPPFCASESNRSSSSHTIRRCAPLKSAWKST